MIGPLQNGRRLFEHLGGSEGLNRKRRVPQLAAVIALEEKA